MAEIEDLHLTERPEDTFRAVSRETCLDIAEEIANLARELAPKGRTGKLAAGFRAGVDGRGAAVVNPVRYWPFVEFGTYNHDAQPHLTTALEIVRARHVGGFRRFMAPVVRAFTDRRGQTRFRDARGRFTKRPR